VVGARCALSVGGGCGTMAAYTFCDLSQLPTPPPYGLPIQLLGRLVCVDEQRPFAWLEAPPAPALRGAGDAPPPPPPPPRLALDTSLLPTADVHRSAKTGLVHALGVLRLEVGAGGEAGGDEDEGGGSGGGGATRLKLQVEVLRLAEGADYAAVTRTVRERAQLLREWQ
jgi:hypothetical protein